MPVTVELDIFSGRPNPKWQLNGKEETGLLDRLMADTSLILSESANTGELGYRGFIISIDRENPGRWKELGFPQIFRIGGIYNDAGEPSRFLLHGPGAEHTIQPNVAQQAEDKISKGKRPVTPLVIDTGCDWDCPDYPEPTGSEPGYTMQYYSAADAGYEADAVTPCRTMFYTGESFGFWNNNKYTRRQNNCYNFAANLRTNTFAQPGRCRWYQWNYLSCTDILNVAFYDGFGPFCTNGPNLVTAMVIWPGVDFHWYQLVAENGHWGHKQGSTRAKNYDSSGNIITDPRTCDRGPYTTWCGFRYANNSTVCVF